METDKLWEGEEGVSSLLLAICSSGLPRCLRCLFFLFYYLMFVYHGTHGTVF